MVQHQGQYPPEDWRRGGEGEKGGRGRRGRGRGKSLQGEAVSAPHPENFSPRCTGEATLEKALGAVASLGKHGPSMCLSQAVRSLVSLG